MQRTRQTPLQYSNEEQEIETELRKDKGRRWASCILVWESNLVHARNQLLQCPDPFSNSFSAQLFRNITR